MSEYLARKPNFTNVKTLKLTSNKKPAESRDKRDYSTSMILLPQHIIYYNTERLQVINIPSI